MSAPDPAPAPWPDQRPAMTDLQYVVYYCKLSIADAAHHTGTTTGKILTELARTGPPPGYTGEDPIRFH